MCTSVSEVLGRQRRSANDLGFGVGISYGYATLGRVGFKGRFDYTAIGSVVNLAARLCERAQASQILVDSKVHGEIKGHMQTESLGEFLPKGHVRLPKTFALSAAQEAWGSGALGMPLPPPTRFVARP
jgi:class 3 adenylate cyclase